MTTNRTIDRCELGRTHADPYATIDPPEGTSQLAAWCYRMITGSGGMNSYEAHEMVVWNNPDDRIDAAEWVLRCLAADDEAADILDAIIERRRETGKRLPRAALESRNHDRRPT